MKKQLVILLLLFVILFTGCTTQEVEREDLHSTPNPENNEFLSVINGGETLDEIETQNVSYYGDVEGYLAKPNNSNRNPGILLVHEWWGLNDNIKNVADVLAGKGYSVLAVDLYNGEVATNSTRANELSSSIGISRSVENMKAGVNYLKNQENVTSVAAWGWCFGGDQTVQLSLSDVELDATIIYYGDVPASGEAVNNLDEPILGVFGEEDTLIPEEQVRSFEYVLQQQNITNTIEIYEGVGHAFANPSSDNFDINATKDSWTKTLKFLDENLN